MRRSFLAILLAFAVIGVSAQAASAAIVEHTWTGVTAFGGSDNLGLFGEMGAMPEGTPYTVKYRFDTTISYFENGTNGSQEVSGGTFYARPAPLIDASITINGIGVPYNGDYASTHFRSTGQGASQISALAQRQLSGPEPYAGELFQRVFRTGNFYDTADLAQPGEFDFTAADNPGGNFSFIARDSAGNVTGNSGFNIIPEHLSISVVPEPTTWALSITALLGVGVLRWRKARRARVL